MGFQKTEMLPVFMELKEVPRFLQLCGTEHIYRIPILKVQEYSLEKIEEKHLNILIPFLPIRFRKQIGEVLTEEKKADTAARENVKRDLAELLSGCQAALGHEGERGVLPESAQKDIREFLWKTCRYLLKKDMDLYEEVSEEVEPAIKLSREIIAELKDDIQELQDDIQELQDSKAALQLQLENACRRMIDEAVKDGKGTEETENMLMSVFSMTKREAEEKVKVYRKE